MNKQKAKGFFCRAFLFLAGIMTSASALASMSGTWVLVFSDNSSIVVSLDDNNGTLSGSVPQYGQTIKGKVYKNGFVFGRWGGGLRVPQFYGGRVSDDGGSLSGAFCHNHSDCTKTFKGIKQ